MDKTIKDLKIAGYETIRIIKPRINTDNKAQTEIQLSLPVLVSESNKN